MAVAMEPRRRLGFGNQVPSQFMRSGGLQTVPDQFVRSGAAPSADSLENQYKLYNTAVEEQAGNYGDIMQGYKNLSAQAQPISTQTYTPESYAYSPTADYTSAVKNMQGLSQTGGYSPEDIANIRERGISPIRSVYANAQRDINRQRSLQGGYSPGYGALKAKMAREMSERLAGQTTNVNAELAQRIAQNKLGIAPSLAATTGRESELAAGYGAKNVEAANEAQRFNIEQPMRTAEFNQQQALKPLQGMQSLYGTTPALAATFGNQALNAAQLQNQISQQNRQRGYGFAGQVLGMRR